MSVVHAPADQPARTGYSHWGATWYLPALAALLVAATVAQLAWSVPRFVGTAASFGLRVPLSLEAAAQVPAWAALACGLAAVAAAVWRRSSPPVPAGVAVAALTVGGYLAAATVLMQGAMLRALAP